jgi:hypothetical protein
MPIVDHHGAAALYPPPAFLFLVLSVCLASLAPLPALAKGQTCETDDECKGKRVCYEGSCMKLKKSESLIRVEVVEPGGVSGSLYIDEVYRGECPWEGIIEPGLHWMHVEAPKMIPAEFQIESLPRQADRVEVRLERDPASLAPAPPTTAQPEEPEGPREKPQMLFAGVYGGGGYGTAQWGESDTQRPAVKMQVGVVAGARLLEDPLWLDLALAISYSTFRIKDPPGARPRHLDNGWTKSDIGDGAHFAVQARLLFPIKEYFFYLGGELEPGYVLSDARYIYAMICPTGSLFFNEWIELRVNPIGFHYVQELTGAGFVAALYGTIGLVVRFFEP